MSDKNHGVEARLASMISTVVVVFCLCNSFESIVFILSSQGLLSIDIVQEYLRPFADLMMVINSGVNVTIFCGFNKDFRDKFCQMYFWKRSKGPAMVSHRGLKLDGAIGQGEICNSLRSENFSKSFLSHIGKNKIKF